MSAERKRGGRDHKADSRRLYSGKTWDEIESITMASTTNDDCFEALSLS